MTYRSVVIICTVWLTGCGHGRGDIDLESKQFTVTYISAPGRGIDTTSLSDFMDSKAIYRFGKTGKGTNHIQLGRHSKDSPFTWQLKGDSLRINNQMYAIRKRDQGFVLQSDSVSILLDPQP